MSDSLDSGAAPLLRTPLFDWHEAHGGRMVGFGGWEMPIQYRSILAEHNATREAVGLFDVSHMGRLAVHGPAAADWLESLLTRRTADLKPGGVRYSLVTDDEGRVLDDLLVSVSSDHGPPRTPSEPAMGSGVFSLGESRAFSLVVNASNRRRVTSWLRSRLPPVGVTLEDRTLDTAMLAVQGPRAVGIVAGLCDGLEEARRLERLRNYTAAAVRVVGRPVAASRTGYTGEDGLELVTAAADAERIWRAILEAGQSLGIAACGLGARDTLRLEAGMPLYGHELVETSDPFALGIGFAVTLEGRRFPGSDRFARLAAAPPARRRVGLIVDSPRPAREGAEVFCEGRSVGTLTSGSYSPTLGRPIAMAMVDAAVADRSAAAAGILTVDVRGRREPVRLTPLPFVSKRRDGPVGPAGGESFSRSLLSSGASDSADARPH